MDDGGVLVLEEGVHLIDVRPVARPEAQMVQADTVLDKAILGVGLVTAANPKGCPTADIIDHILTAEGLLETQKGQQCFVEASAAVPLTHRQNDVSHPIHLDHGPS